MKRTITNVQTRLYLISGLILLVGLGSAILIYLTADNTSDSDFRLEDSKMYMHDLELYGGKANVMANEMRNWFDGLWHGKSLAFTVAFIAVSLSLGFFFAARHLPHDQESDS